MEKERFEYILNRLYQQDASFWEGDEIMEGVMNTVSPENLTQAQNEKIIELLEHARVLLHERAEQRIDAIMLLKQGKTEDEALSIIHSGR